MRESQLTVIIIIALACVTILESIALFNHINGVIFGSVITIFGVFIGAAGSAIFRRKK